MCRVKKERSKGEAGWEGDIGSWSDGWRSRSRSRLDARGLTVIQLSYGGQEVPSLHITCNTRDQVTCQ